MKLNEMPTDEAPIFAWGTAGTQWPAAAIPVFFRICRTTPFSAQSWSLLPCTHPAHLSLGSLLPFVSHLGPQRSVLTAALLHKPFISKCGLIVQDVISGQPPPVMSVRHLHLLGNASLHHTGSRLLRRGVCICVASRYFLSQCQFFA